MFSHQFFRTHLVKNFGKSKIIVDSKPKMAHCNTTKIKVHERLSSYVRPINYSLCLIPNLKTGLYEGTVKILVEIDKEKSSVILHSKGLRIKTVQMYDSEKEIAVQKFLTLKHVEQLLIQLEKPINPGTYDISIEFDGTLKGHIVGLYLSNLKNRTMVASKFQPTYAREAFPCFDEPQLKATYDISLIKPSSYVALSNMNAIETRPDKLGEKVTFATSVPMSTYLACFVICDFDHKELEINSDGIGNNFKMRSFAQKGETHKIDFAQDIGKRAVEFYIQYYQVPFPLPKLDMIAIPDYVSGATEHWGLITYRETSFLIDENTASASNKYSVANTIAHELAHMWFGNLVTMKWWDDVWLNEGFASYMQVKALNAIEPSWSMLDQFLVRTLHPVLKFDGQLSSHAIVQNVTTPDEITAIFDAISYNKGASVLRMLEGFVGENNFRQGVTDYLKKYEFGNTVTEDLLNALEPYFKKHNSDLDIKYVMDTWTKQMGYPLLSVKKGESANTYVISQTRFLNNPEAKYDENSSPFKYRWCIPITYKTNKKIYENVLWFKHTDDKVSITLHNDETWLKINNNQVGYYRVNYTEELWEELIKNLESQSKQVTVLDWAQLINDAHALSESRLLRYDLSLRAAVSVRGSTNYGPWAAADRVFDYLADKLMLSSAYNHLMIFVQNVVEPMYLKQSWQKITNSTVIESLMRAQILNIAAEYGLPDAVSNVRKIFMQWLDNHSNGGNKIDPDLRSLIYYNGMREATPSTWDKLWQIYINESDVQELSKLRAALSAPRDVTILQKYMELAWDEKNVRSQDYLSVLQLISARPGGATVVWGALKQLWPRLVDRYSLNSRILAALIPAITKNFNTEAKLKEVEEFFGLYPDAGAGVTHRQRALEQIRGNIAWAQHIEPIVAAYLEKNALNIVQNIKN